MDNQNKKGPAPTASGNQFNIPANHPRAAAPAQPPARPGAESQAHADQSDKDRADLDRSHDPADLARNKQDAKAAENNAQTSKAPQAQQTGPAPTPAPIIARVVTAADAGTSDDARVTELSRERATLDGSTGPTPHNTSNVQRVNDIDRETAVINKKRQDGPQQERTERKP